MPGLDIYITEEVDALKRDYAELWRRYEEAVRENAQLESKLYAITYGRRGESECEWMNVS